MTPLSLLLSRRLRTCHVGAAHAISRRDLLRWLRGVGVETTDRKMRYAIKELGDVCMCSRGYYIAANVTEAKAAIAYLRKKIFPLWEDVKAIERAYPECGQLDLPLGV